MSAEIIAAAAPPQTSAMRQFAWLSLAMFFGATLWFSATTATVQIIAEFNLTQGETLG